MLRTTNSAQLKLPSRFAVVFAFHLLLYLYKRAFSSVHCQSVAPQRHSETAGSDDESGFGDPPIDVCATMLATLDQRSHQRRLLRDANEFMQAIMMPMSFPWQHRVIPVARNIPCDIDEMPAILTADDGIFAPFENGPLGYGRFDVGQLRRGASTARLMNWQVATCSAARRTSDPGVIELSTFSLPPNKGNDNRSTEHVPEKQPRSDNRNQSCSCPSWDRCDLSERGEISLRCFEQARSCKKRKIEQSRSCVRKKYVSVKVHSSSSRSSIFSPESATGILPRFLPTTAVLPLEVQNGRFVNATKAKEVAERLGTYSCRYGLGPTNPSGKNSNRVATGRTRIIWTEKSPSDLPQRVFFTSLLTGERLEAGTQKRPREVKTLVKLSGNIWRHTCLATSPPGSSNADTDVIRGKLASLDQDLDGISGSVFGAQAQCSLDADQLVTNIMKDKKVPAAHKCRTDLVGAESPGLLLHTPAQLECIPDNNGVICVLCSKPGSFSLGSSVHNLLNQSARQSEPICTVCWSLGKNSAIDTVEICQDCGVLAHIECCLDPGVKITVEEGEISKSKWRCAVCCRRGQDKVGTTPVPETLAVNRKPRRAIRMPPKFKDSHIETLRSKRTEPSSPLENEVKCSLCPFSGGAMSPFEMCGKTLWIHEVCRIWRVPTSPTGSTQSGLLQGLKNPEICALCGEKGGADTLTPSNDTDENGEALLHSQASYPLLKCAAARCQVRFHAMCAFLSSMIFDRDFEDREIGFEGKAAREEAKNDHPPEASLVSNLLRDAKKNDCRLCKQFTLAAIDCFTVTGSQGKDPGNQHFRVLPVAFCGIHNPKRDRAFYGLYPGGCHLGNSAMRIPPSVTHEP